MSPEYAVTRDSLPSLEWLIEHDRHVPAAWVERCVRNGEYLVAEAGRERVGFLRFSWFWGSIPYMDMIAVVEAHRGRGVGTRLVAAWQAAMEESGARLLMTSAMSDEPEPLAWHRRNGFSESGRLTFVPLQETPEVFMVKALERAGGLR